MSTRKILTETKHRPKTIDTYRESDKLIMGKSYWAFHNRLTSKGNSLLYHSGVFQVIPKPRENSKIIDWDEIGLKNKGVSYHNILSAVRHSTVYENQEDCIAAHDKEIKEFAKGLKTDDRDAILSKLINKKEAPKISNIEKDSRAWIKSLDKQQKKYLRWVKEYYEDEI